MGSERMEEGEKRNLVQDILSIEVEADQRVAQAREEAAALWTKVQQQVAGIRSGVEETIRAEREKLRVHYERLLEEERGKLEKAHQLRLQKIMTVDEEKCRALVEELVKRVVEG